MPCLSEIQPLKNVEITVIAVKDDLVTKHGAIRLEWKKTKAPIIRTVRTRMKEYLPQLVGLETLQPRDSHLFKAQVDEQLGHGLLEELIKNLGVKDESSK